MKKLALSVLIAATLFPPLPAAALEVRESFNPSMLIPDPSFADTNTFGGPEGIQRFLESKGSVLANTSPAFLAQLGEPTDVALKTKLDDPQPNLPRLRTAAELIWDAARSGGMNPQVIIVTLHKEQGLVGPVTDQRLPKALRNAMGFACPDASGCGNLFPSFYHQLFGNVDLEGNRYLGAVKSLMKSYNMPNGRGPTVAGAPATVGQSVDILNTLGDYDGVPAKQTVTMGNRATAALYRYTPHVFNGNYNFWNFFTSWFRYPNGTLLKSTFDGTTFIINNGQRQRVPAFVAVSRGLALGNAIGASPTEINEYPQGPTYGPVDNTVISLDGKHYVFLDGVKHPSSSFVLTQRKLDPAAVTQISAAEAELFPTGAQLTPYDGTVLKAVSSPDVYLVEKGVLKRYSAFTFAQYGAAPKMQVIADEEVASYPKGGFVPPKDGTLIKARFTSDVYVMSAGRRLPLTGDLFKNRGYSFKNVNTLTTDEEIASIPLGPIATPAEDTYFTMGKQLFVFKQGTKHPVFPFVAKQRGMSADYAFEESIAGQWPDGIAIPPNDGTLFRSVSKPAVYVTAKGQGRPLTGELFKLRKYSFANVVTLEDALVEALPKGPFAAPPEQTYYKVAENGDFFRYQDGVKRRILPFVAKQRGMTPDHTFSAEVSDSWEEGTPVIPKDYSLVQAEGGTQVHVVIGGVLRPLTDAAFKARGYKTANVQTVAADVFVRFPLGALIAK